MIVKQLKLQLGETVQSIEQLYIELRPAYEQPADHEPKYFVECTVRYTDGEYYNVCIPIANDSTTVDIGAIDTLYSLQSIVVHNNGTVGLYLDVSELFRSMHDRSVSLYVEGIAVKSTPIYQTVD